MTLPGAASRLQGGQASCGGGGGCGGRGSTAESQGEGRGCSDGCVLCMAISAFGGHDLHWHPLLGSDIAYTIVSPPRDPQSSTKPSRAAEGTGHPALESFLAPEGRVAAGGEGSSARDGGGVGDVGKKRKREDNIFVFPFFTFGSFSSRQTKCVSTQFSHQGKFGGTRAC